MKKALTRLDRFFAPALILGSIALSVILLAVSPSPSLLLSMLWAALMAAGMRWGIWGILHLTRKISPSPALCRILTRMAEGLLLLLAAGAVVLGLLFREIPSVWFFLPAVLFGLQGAVRFDVTAL